MKANETQLQLLIEGIKQYVVPLFQRPYSWGKKHWKTLWNDLLELYKDENPKAHFLGSIVTAHANAAPEGIPKFLLIDGQQRLTTLFILLCVLRDYAKTEGGDLSEQIHNLFLINQYQRDIEAFKLLPTQSDRLAFSKLIESHQPFENDSLITEAYQFFMSKLKLLKSPKIEKLQRILVNNVYMVSIVLERDDNPYLIFESLNAKGRPLTQGDLVRNYFLMRVHTKQQEAIFNRLWKPMECRLGNKLTTFFRHFLLSQYLALTEDEVYLTLKNICDQQSEEAVINYLQRLERFSQYYEQFIDPNLCQVPGIRHKLEALKIFDLGTCFPFLLFVFDRLSKGDLIENEVVDTLAIIENFIIRRDVCGIASNTYSKIFSALPSQMELTAGENFSAKLKEILSTKIYPSDKEFQQRLISTPLYGLGERRRKTKFILVSLEGSFEHKEKINLDDLTIEHVMPQTLNKWWRAHLGEKHSEIYRANLHTLGNLTLTGYNSELSNLDFPHKKQILMNSPLQLNHYFAECETWGADDIKKRAEVMAEKALRLWPGFGSGHVSEKSSVPVVTGTRPVEVLILGQSTKVSRWVDVLRITLEALFSFKPNLVDNCVQSFPRYLSQNEGSLRRAHRLTNNMYLEKNLSSLVSYEFCQKVTAFFGISSDEYSIQIEGGQLLQPLLRS